MRATYSRPLTIEPLSAITAITDEAAFAAIDLLVVAGTAIANVLIFECGCAIGIEDERQTDDCRSG
ncbi:hypothetical protein CT676_43460 [Bradyrhizobium sp. MOS001]|uniref:hypothetical protein n=1 Tax=unclassified Bradyrhizobium TaxID=2631580 RepID=UPI001074CFAE|nr:hypothetical protein [Bradyrhizobium sp. MOS001]TFW51184.1 hypothetical protein CT676_43460 [Bradyrhizobium sp. MOS001]